MLKELLRAIDEALAGQWDAAHRIVQNHETDAAACWIHAVLHKIEGDLGNSSYWYRRAGKPALLDRDAWDELRQIKTELEAQHAKR